MFIIGYNSFINFILKKGELFMDSKMTKQEYSELVKQKTPNSTLLKNCIMAFLFGGAICVVGEALLKMYQSAGLEQEDAATMVSVTLIFLSTFLTGLNIYPKMAKYAGAGTIVPITGFANAVAAPALEAKTEGYVLGVGAKIFTIAGPVILFGTLASVIAGIIYFIIL